jgi:Helicase HerA, central domain
MTTELEAFRTVDFNWVRQLRGIWRDPPYHVDLLHQALIDDIFSYFEKETNDVDPANEPQGRIIVGPAGLGKTHLIGELRRRVWEKGGFFVLLDFVGIKDFWPSVALGFLNSLQIRTAEDKRQYDILILRVAQTLALEPQLSDIYNRLRGRPRELILELARVFINALANKYPDGTLQHHDVLRALILLISEDLECASVAHAWLQGIDLEPAEVRSLGFKSVKRAPIEIIRGVAWLMSLVAPTMIAVDQIDAIVSESNARSPSSSGSNDEQREAQSIIEALAGGLIDLHEVKCRSVTVVASLEATWNVLEKRATAAWSARYRKPDVLQPLTNGKMGQALVGARVSQAYERCNFQAQYRTWPFPSEAFETAIGFSPRQLLRACEDHRLYCVSEGRVTELRSFAQGEALPQPRPVTGLDALLDRELKGANIVGLLEQNQEERLRALLVDGLALLAMHLDLPDDIDVEFRGDPDQRRPSLHGRLSFTFHSDNDREQHFCFRILVHSNAIAFQSRLNAAILASGVDRSLSFRHLFILRSGAPPSGSKTTQLVQKFLQAGGKFIEPTDGDLRTLVALRSMRERNLDGFDVWLRNRKPLFDTALFKSADMCPPQFLQPPKPGGEKSAPSDTSSGGAEKLNALPSAPGVADQTTQTTDKPGTGLQQIPIGRRYERSTPGNSEELPADLLMRHVAIIAGSGSGKTVLLRRIVEEAALLGIPAIVLDTNNDLARLGDKWPDRPKGWTDEDVGKAAKYTKRVEVVIWTPGRSSGNPIALGLLPDFSALADDADARDQAVGMANATLVPWIGATGANAALKRGVFADALRLFAKNGGKLEDLIELLSDLPDGVSQIGNASKLAAGIADQLRAAIATNPLIQSRGPSLDARLLFEGGNRKTRISIISFIGLPSDEARQSFVNQLNMSLFTWIKRNPSATGRLYVLDEAQNLAPSQKTTPCKESTVSLVAQARKYGLGMIFATQLPKGIDNKIVSNCTTHFYGRMSSPATIDATRDLMLAKGGGGDDIARLNRGEFYFSTEGMMQPIKIHAPLCLTWHPQNPLTEEEVLAKTRREYFDAKFTDVEDDKEE